MNRNFIVFFLIFFNPFTPLSGQNNRYSFNHLDYRDGLSNNHVICASEDNKGFMWFGTMSGLNRYDGYSFKVFKSDPFDTTSLPDNLINLLECDQRGRFWIRSFAGICVFDPEKETFERKYELKDGEDVFSMGQVSTIFPYGDSLLFFVNDTEGMLRYNVYTEEADKVPHNRNIEGSVSPKQITDIKKYGDQLCVIYTTGLIEIVNPETFQVTRTIHDLEKQLNILDSNFKLLIDSDQDIWIYSNNYAYGVYWIRNKSNEAVHISNTSDEFTLNSNIVSKIVQDNDGMLWIGTDHGGINLVDKSTGEVIYLMHDNDNENSLSQNSVTNMFKDSSGIVWVLTFKKGVNFYHKNLFKFQHFIPHSSDSKSLTYNDVNCFAEERNSNLWIGTNGQGLVYFDRKKHVFTNFRHDPDNPASLSNDVIVSLLYDDGVLWIGTFSGGLCRFDGKQFKTYKHQPDNPKSIGDDTIWEIFKDSEGRLWIGTLGAGMVRFDPEKEEFYPEKGIDQSCFVMDIDEDNAKNLFISTDEGFYTISNTGRVHHFKHIQNDKKSLSIDLVFCSYPYKPGLVWVGTRNGLNLFDLSTGTFKKFPPDINLSGLQILSILESKNGDLWVSTPNGLSMISMKDLKTNEFLETLIINFDETDGLQGREFNEGSALRTRNGELIFGGSNGFNLFHPDSMHFENKPLVTYITGLDIFGKTVKVNDKINGRKIIYSAILNNQKIRLKYKENIFSLEFTALNHIRSKKILYRYKLEGFNEQWITSDMNLRKATFTNLNPGSYTFRVQSSILGDNWKSAEASMDIVIMPPFYRSYLAYAMYLVIIFGILFLMRRILIIRERMKFQSEQAMLESKRQQELNVMKTRFFTNVSHEFRTPLTLVITPLDKLLKNIEEGEVKQQLFLIYQNARRLLSLVNQLLDFRKMEEHRIVLNPTYDNVVVFVKNTIKSFNDLAETKDIVLIFLSHEKELFMQFDKDKLEKILFNLLSNAFKFTQEGGKIIVELKLGKNKQQKELIKIRVTDNGIGIPKEKHRKIFEWFFQNRLPSNIVSRGSGIGLSLAREFVRLHGGKIRLKSEPGKGSVFTVIIPVNRDQNMLKDGAISDTDIHLVKKIDPEVKEGKDRVTIMLVEDNDDFRFYLRDNLRSAFNILEARNGKVALEMLKKNMPDLIVSDVMMPEMDGLELCKNVKSNPDISHIPLILLTAKTTEQDKLAGLEMGADEYIIKPFNFEILESRINYFISKRQKFIKKYQKNFSIEPNAVGITPLDEKLMKKALKWVEDNIASSDLSVESLSSELGVSRVHLYKKMVALTGKSPVEFIRLVRLKRAAQLLGKSQLTVSEVAYQVGFSDPRYFSKQFKAEFGILPSQYKDQQS